jgi:hypothetical protein
VLFRLGGPFASAAPCQRTDQRSAAATPRDGDRLVLEATLQAETLVSGLRLRHPVPAPGLAIREVTLSDDGRIWRPAEGARRIQDWGWAGRTLFAVSDGAMEVVFGPARARHVRVTAVTPADRESLAILCIRGLPTR